MNALHNSKWQGALIIAGSGCAPHQQQAAEPNFHGIGSWSVDLLHTQMSGQCKLCWLLCLQLLAAGTWRHVSSAAAAAGGEASARTCHAAASAAPRRHTTRAAPAEHKARSLSKQVLSACIISVALASSCLGRVMFAVFAQTAAKYQI
jgi:hypothetical protein